MENFKAKDLELTDVIDISVLFKTSAYIASNGKENKKYLLTKDGFTILAMGFTGAKALDWKLKYIKAFNKMNSVEDKLFKSIDERFEKYEENYRPTHKNKMDISNYIRSGLGEDREDGEADLVKQRVLMILNGEAWQDIPYEKVKTNKGTYGVDEQSIEDFEENLNNNLYKIWNRMS